MANDDFGRFKFWTGDVDYLTYGGTWHWSPRPGEHHFIRVFNWADTVGEREAAEVGETYNMELAVVITAEIAPRDHAGALRCVGLEEHAMELADAKKYVELDQLIAGACFDYGNKARITDTDTSNFHRTFRELKRDSLEAAEDPTVLDSRIVNRIGQTAREFMAGQMGPALDRGLEEGDPAVGIIAQMYKSADGQTLGGHIDQSGDTVMAVIAKHDK
jgi:hypothetical protein